MSSPSLPLGLAVSALVLSIAAPARAHLLPAGHATVNVVGHDAFCVGSVPVSTLESVDDDGDGTLDRAELARHEDDVRAQIEGRFSVGAGDDRAHVVRVDLVLSPEHDASPDRAEHVIFLEHVAFEGDPLNDRDVRVVWDLFGARETEHEVAVTVTLHPDGRKEMQTATLTRAQPEHLFFSKPARGEGAIGRWPVGVGGASLMVLTGIAIVGKRRRRS